MILEPTGAVGGRLPVAAEFVRQVRESTARHGVLLIFDEVVTGFRITPGGAQRRLGIKPDLTTMAKIVAGGLPGGAVGGRADILDQIAMSGGARRVAHPGTFNANPLSAVAGGTCLGLVASEPLTERADRAAGRLCAGMNRLFADSGTQGFAYHDSSLLHVAPNVEGDGSPAAVAAALPALSNTRGGAVAQSFRLALLNEGVDAMRGVSYIVSALHSDADIDATLGAFGRALGTPAGGRDPSAPRRRCVAGEPYRRITGYCGKRSFQVSILNTPTLLTIGLLQGNELGPSNGSICFSASSLLSRTFLSIPVMRMK